MNLITTGVDIVVQGATNAMNQMRNFGQVMNTVNAEFKNYSKDYDRHSNQIIRSSNNLTRVLNRNWSQQYKNAMAGGRQQKTILENLERQYDRAFREIGNRYQSMIMGSVALSMSGISLLNMGQGTLGFTKGSLDMARDFETIMEQIRFYGQKTREDMEQIQKDIFAIDLRIPAMATEVGESILQAQKTGYNYQDSLYLGEEASKMSFLSLGKLDGEESMKFMSHMQRLTGINAENIESISDKITMTADVSAASVDSLWRTIQSSRSAFDNLNTDMDSMLAISAVMSDRLQPRMAGMALSSFGRGINMAEKAGMENRGTRGQYYNELTKAMGGTFDSYGGDVLGYIEDVAQVSTKLWGDGAERTGKLISIFGNSAIDLFHAYDAYAQHGNRTMREMREEIQQSAGHSDRLMETLMNTSYGTEMILQSTAQQFQILFGQTLRPVFNDILRGITNIIGKVNEFMQQHPKLAKVIGYGVGITGLLLTATGATFLFVGGILAIYSSLANVIVQLARNTKVVHLLGQGYETAGQMLKGQFLNPLKLVGRNLLKMTGITFFMYMAWKNDFFRMRTVLMDWYEYTRTGIEEAVRLFGIYGASSAKEWQRTFEENQDNGVLDNWITNTILKLGVLAGAVRDIWSDGVLDKDTYDKVNTMGLLGLVEQIYEIKTAITDFWEGFEQGVTEGIRLFNDMIQPLRDAWEWISEQVFEVLQQFGYFENTDNISTAWGKVGNSIGNILGAMLAIRGAIWVWGKALKLVLLPFNILIGGGKKLYGWFKKIKDLFKGGGKGGGLLGGLMRGIGAILLPKSLRGIGKKVKNLFNRMFNRGAFSTIPGTTTLPHGGTTGTPKGKRGRGRSPIYYNTGPNSNPTTRGKGIKGRMKDIWYGRAYVPERKTDKNGRAYHTITTADGRSTRTTADGKVKGKSVRTGGLSKIFANIGTMFTGFFKGGFKGMFKNLGKGFKNFFKAGNLKALFVNGAKGLGKGLLTGFKFVLTKGIPLLFKGLFRLIPIVGWAVMIWDIIQVLWNWDWFQDSAKWVWGKIEDFGKWAWDGILGIGEWVWDKIWGFAKDIFIKLTPFSEEQWGAIGKIMSNKLKDAKEWAGDIFSGIGDVFKNQWRIIKDFVFGNPLKATINLFKNDKEAKDASSRTTVIQDKTNVASIMRRREESRRTGYMPGRRTGEWNVPKDNMPFLLHQGEMVLTRAEAQLMRSMVGRNNSISGFLRNAGESTIRATTRKMRRLSFSKAEQETTTQSTGQGNGETTIVFKEGAVQVHVANSSPSEIRKGAKQMFEEFKRLVEKDNIRNYRPARPRTT